MWCSGLKKRVCLASMMALSCPLSLHLEGHLSRRGRLGRCRALRMTDRLGGVSLSSRSQADLPGDLSPPPVWSRGGRGGNRPALPRSGSERD